MYVQSGVEDEEGDHVEVVSAFGEDLLLEDFHGYFALPLLVKLPHRHIREILLQFCLLAVEQLLQTVADHQRYLVASQVAIIERTDSFQNSCQLLLRSFAQTDADDLDELLPTDEIAKVTDVLYQLVTWVHVQSFQTHFERFTVDSPLHDVLHRLRCRIPHQCHLLEGLVQIIQIVDFEAIQPVLFDQVGNILRAEK